jgi:hypothetical protein
MALRGIGVVGGGVNHDARWLRAVAQDGEKAIGPQERQVPVDDAERDRGPQAGFEKPLGGLNRGQQAEPAVALEGLRKGLKHQRIWVG